jgi:hypothetical protein
MGWISVDRRRHETALLLVAYVANLLPLALHVLRNAPLAQLLTSLQFVLHIHSNNRAQCCQALLLRQHFGGGPQNASSRPQGAPPEVDALGNRRRCANMCMCVVLCFINCVCTFSCCFHAHYEGPVDKLSVKILPLYNILMRGVLLCNKRANCEIKLKILQLSSILGFLI